MIQFLSKKSALVMMLLAFGFSAAYAQLDCASNPDAIICDDFESYDPTMTTGQQASHWTTWSGNVGGGEDGVISSAFASSGTQSMAVIGTAAGGGPQDILLDLGGSLTSGHFHLKHKFYIPAGKAAYYNIQDVVPLVGGAGNWNANVTFNADGTGEIDNVAAVVGEFTYSQDAWTTVEHIFDLDNDLTSFWINGTLVWKGAYPKNLGGLDYFPIDPNYEFYVDDVEFVALPPVVYDADECATAVDLTALFGAAPAVVNVSAVQDNTGSTVAADDVAGTCWGETGLDATVWYTFTGDGGTYYIQTVECGTDTNYIDGGDTQLAIYTGDCGNLTQVACSDDQYPTGDPDWSAGVLFETDPGVDYRMIIDGYNYQGFVSIGQFCISVEAQPTVSCADGAVGSTSVANNGFVCLNQGTGAVLSIPDPAEFVIPNIGPIFGMVWAISTEPLTNPAEWPADNASFWGSFAVAAAPYVPNLANDNDPLTHGIWYFTPIVVAGAVDPTPATPAFMTDLDVSNGCFFVGQSQQLVLLPGLSPITATADIVPDNGTGTGGIDLTAAGGFTDLAMQDANTYAWSNGATTQDIAGLTSGDYTVTISDISGCVDDGVFTFMVGTVSAEDPASVKELTFSPNPTSGMANLNLTLETAADVRIEMVNSVGQIVYTQNVGRVQNLNTPLDFSNLATGIYMMRVTLDGQSAIRTVSVKR